MIHVILCRVTSIISQSISELDHLCTLLSRTIILGTMDNILLLFSNMLLNMLNYVLLLPFLKEEKLLLE